MATTTMAGDDVAGLTKDERVRGQEIKGTERTIVIVCSRCD